MLVIPVHNCRNCLGSNLTDHLWPPLRLAGSGTVNSFPDPIRQSSYARSHGSTEHRPRKSPADRSLLEKVRPPCGKEKQAYHRQTRRYLAALVFFERLRATAEYPSRILL